MWVGIIDENVLERYFLPLMLNDASYTNFLQQQLPILLENVPLAIRQRIWFMHIGVPAHRWIGRAGPQSWPPRLNHLELLHRRSP